LNAFIHERCFVPQRSKIPAMRDLQDQNGLSALTFHSSGSESGIESRFG
jgi:hypothetical protein